MMIIHDAEADALRILFTETTVTTQHVTEGIAADCDEAGRLAGLEMLDGRSRLSGVDTFRRIILEGSEGGVPASPRLPSGG